MTLLDAKDSTKDVDFMCPDNKEYNYLTGILKDLGYKSINARRWKKENEAIVIDLYPGKNIHTTELLESPLKKGNHIHSRNIGRIYLGVLNYYDLISSKIFRGESVDFEDCLKLVQAKGKEIDKDLLVKRFHELASYDVSEERIKGHLRSFLVRWEKEEGLNGK